MNKNYEESEISKKEFRRKNKNNNRKLSQKVSHSSYDSSKDKLDELDEWDEYEDLSFEKFKNGKR